MKRHLTWALVFFGIGIGIANAADPTFEIKMSDGSHIYDPSIITSLQSVVYDYLKLNPESEILGDVFVENASPGENVSYPIHFETKMKKRKARVDIQVTLDYTSTGDGDGYGYGYYSINHYQVSGK